ncbi:MAG TPA: RDD family protein [Chloroflexia bacterium]|nr:RDD family protein [Chloroflexia bacterium]
MQLTDDDDQFTVATPELVAFGYEVAGIGSRFIAALVDTALIATIYLLIQVAGLAVSFGGQNLFNKQGTSLNFFFLGLLTIIGFVVLWGYYVFFETLWNGQTPGKRLTHLRVVRDDSSPIGFWEALIRNLIRILDFLPLAYGFGVVTMFVNGRARRLGDFAAGTLVVREGSAVTLPQLLARTSLTATAPAGRAAPDSPLAAALQVRRLTPADLQLIREVMARQATLLPLAGWDLCLKATQVVAARTGLQGTISDPRAFLVEVLRLAERRPAGADAAPDAPAPA